MSPRASFEHALLLIARRHGGDKATALAAEQALADWRGQKPEHDTIYRLALDAWQSTSPNGLESEIPRPAPPNIRRRKVVTALSLFGTSIVTGAFARWWWLQPIEMATLETGRAQMLTQTMGDGSELSLAARTTAGVVYFRNRREVTLTSGELRLQVSRDPSRPFTVRTDRGRVEVLGTTFTVALRGGAMSVEVAEGHVAVWRAHGMGAGNLSDNRPPDFNLRAGDAVRIDDEGSTLHNVPVAGIGAWKDGWMVFDQTLLAEALLRWNDYLTRPLALGTGNALANLKLTGSFRLAEPDVFLQALPKILPVKLVPQQDGKTVVALR